MLPFGLKVLFKSDLLRFFPELCNASDLRIVSRSRWINYTDFISPVQCVPLHQVLNRANIRHVNYFILDTEGAELDILKTIDWSTVRFDVLTVETEVKRRPKNYREDVSRFLRAHGYDHVMDKGRNSWYVHRNFRPYRRPLWRAMLDSIHGDFLFAWEIEALFFQCLMVTAFIYFTWKRCQKSLYAKK